MKHTDSKDKDGLCSLPSHGHRCSESGQCRTCIQSRRDWVRALRDVVGTTTSLPQASVTTAVERPLHFNSIKTLEKGASTYAKQCPGFGWAFENVRRFSSVGYQVELLEQLFSSLSTGIFDCSVINDAILTFISRLGVKYAVCLVGPLEFPPAWSWWQLPSPARIKQAASNRRLWPGDFAGPASVLLGPH